MAKRASPMRHLVQTKAHARRTQNRLAPLHGVRRPEGRDVQVVQSAFAVRVLVAVDQLETGLQLASNLLLKRMRELDAVLHGVERRHVLGIPQRVERQAVHRPLLSVVERVPEAVVEARQQATTRLQDAMALVPERLDLLYVAVRDGMEDEVELPIRKGKRTRHVASNDLDLSCSNLDTARKLSESMGSYTAIAQSTSRTKGANTGSTGTSEGLVRRPLITPDELQRWTGRETGALVTHDGVPMAFPSRDVTETFVGPMLGMTSPDAERTLMEQSVARRETKNEAVPKVWNGPAVPDATAAEPARAKTVAGYVPEGF